MINSIIISGPSSKWSTTYDQIISKTLGISSDKLINFYQSPDFQIFKIDEKDSIKIEEIRSLQNEINFRPTLYKFRFYVWENAEKMTIPAQNSFLKTLEEHNENTILILCTVNFNLLLPTIISRCQKILIPFSTKDTTEEISKEVEKILPLIFSDDIGEKFKAAEMFPKEKQEALELLDNTIVIVRGLMINSICNNASVTNYSLPKLTKFLEKSFTTRKEIVSNINPRFALENLFMSC